MRAPAMPHNLQIKAGRATQVGLKRQRLILFAPATHRPANRQRPRTEPHNHAGIFKPMGREVQPGLQPRSAQPMRFQNAALARARGLHPAQRRHTFFPIVMSKHQEPQPKSGNRGDNVNQQKAAHYASSDANGTSLVAEDASGQLPPQPHASAAGPAICGKAGVNPLKIRMRAPAHNFSDRYNGPWPSPFAISRTKISTPSGALTRLVFLLEFPILARNCASTCAAPQPSPWSRFRRAQSLGKAKAGSPKWSRPVTSLSQAS